jgi:hypothetical protein
MDQALIAYFDERFREVAQQVQGLHEEVAQQVQGLREEAAQQFQGLREEVAQQVQGLREEVVQQIQGLREEVAQQVQGLREEVVQQIQGLREETLSRFAEVDRQFGETRETARLTLVLVEDLRDDLHLVAEAFMGLNQRVERVEDKAALSFETVRGWLEPYFKSAEERGRELDARSVQLEVPVKDLDNRVRTLEGWAARQGEDVKESLVKMVARHRSQPTSPPR